MHDEDEQDGPDPDDQRDWRREIDRDRDAAGWPANRPRLVPPSEHGFSDVPGNMIAVADLERALGFSDEEPELLRCDLCGAVNEDVVYIHETPDGMAVSQNMCCPDGQWKCPT